MLTGFEAGLAVSVTEEEGSDYGLRREKGLSMARQAGSS